LFNGNNLISEALGLENYKVDIHSHILPEFDDGSRSIGESIYLAKEIKENGTDAVIWTPHFSHPKYPEIGRKSILAHFNRYKELIEKETGLRLFCGGEMYFNPEVEKNLITLGETNYVLMEFDFNTYPLYLKDKIYDLQLEGYEIIFAHVERYNWLVDEKKGIFRTKYDFSLVEYLKSRNIFFQVNFSTLRKLNNYKAIKHMLKENMIEFVGSDKHRKNDGRNVICWSDF